jgi:hypothetical protein
LALQRSRSLGGAAHITADFLGGLLVWERHENLFYYDHMHAVQDCQWPWDDVDEAIVPYCLFLLGCSLLDAESPAIELPYIFSVSRSDALRRGNRGHLHVSSHHFHPVLKTVSSALIRSLELLPQQWPERGRVRLPRDGDSCGYSNSL